MPELKPSAALAALGDAFAAQGHDLVFVGGCVRDSILGLDWKDVDLATSATPDEQISVYREAGIRYFETGLKHGTITAMVDGEPHEITTYRTDVETDGRHATVEFTRSLEIDLERRDLTINALAMRFDGTIVDPFGGRADALGGVIRFVGDADDRLREDFLRILRWFRFTGRFLADDGEPDPESLAAVARNAAGLARISVERIWSETARIATGRGARRMMRLMANAGVADVVGLPRGDDTILDRAADLGLTPAGLIGAYVARTEPARTLALRWKMSNEERRDAVMMAERRIRDVYGLADAKLDLVDGAPRRNVVASLRMRGLDADAETAASWVVPEMPVDGSDLIALGMRQGVELGRRMKAMRREWIASDYQITRERLLAGTE